MEKELESSFSAFCDICKEDNTNIEGVGYCSICNQYLCGQCKQYHRRVASTKDHKIRDLTDLPSNSPKKEESSSDEIMSPLCKHHPGKFLELFCIEHNVGLCKTCEIVSHRKCTDVQPLSKIASERAYECDNMLEHFNHFQNCLKQLNTMKGVELSDLGAKKSKAIDKIKFKRRVFDLMEQKAIQEVDDVYKKEVKVINKELELIKHTEPMVKEARTTIEHAVRVGNDEEKFLTAQTMKKEENTFKEIISDTSKMCKRQITFTDNEEIVKISDLGKVCLTKEEVTEDVLCPIQECFNPRTPTDNAGCFIKSMEILPDGKLILNDIGNTKLKLFSNEYNFLCELCLDSPAVSLVAISVHEVVICCPEDEVENLLRIKINDNNMYHESNIKTKLKVDIIAKYSADSLSIMTFDDQANNFWQIANLDGDIQKSVKLDAIEIVSPSAMRSDNGKLYYLDRILGLTVLDDKGICTNEYEQDNAKYYGLAIDELGHIYTSVKENDECINIAKLSPEGYFIKMLFPEFRKYGVAPLTCLENKLYVYNVMKGCDDETVSGNEKNDGNKEGALCDSIGYIYHNLL